MTKPKSTTTAKLARKSHGGSAPREFAVAPFKPMVGLFSIDPMLEQLVDNALAVLQREYPDIYAAIAHERENTEIQDPDPAHETDTRKDEETRSGGTDRDQPECDEEPDENYTRRYTIGSLDGAVETYLHQRQVYTDRPAADFNKELETLEEAVNELKRAMASAPNVARIRINGRLQRIAMIDDRDWYRALTGIEAKRPMEWIDSILNDLLNVCEGNREPIVRGKPPKTHIFKAVKFFVNLWFAAGNTFDWQFGSAPGHNSTEEFTGKGPQFVWRMMTTIDSEVQFAEVRTALKDLSKDVNADKARKSTPSHKKYGNPK